MHARIIAAILLVGMAGWVTGCRKENVDKAQFKSAIQNSLAHKHDCVWSDPVKMPAEADPAKDERTRDFDALTDAGLLARAPEEKKRFLIGSKPVNLYDLSDKGHAAWQPDPSRPGYGNFCFGHFNVTSIATATPNDPTNPTQYTVTYNYEVEGIPAWASTPESMRTFPKIAKDTSVQSASVTLVKDSNGGWVVSPPPAAPAGQ
jgi:hypothetical protein